MIWWRDYRDDPSTHPGVNGAEMDLIGGERDATSPVVRVKWAGLLADRGLVCVTLSYFCANYVFYLFFNWFFYYLTEIRYVPATLGGYFTAAQWMVGAVTSAGGRQRRP